MISHGNVHRRQWQHAGKQRAAYEYSFTYTKDGQTLRARGQAPSRGEALEAMEARKAALAAPVAAPAAVTLGEYADKWLAAIVTSVERQTLQSYTNMLKNHVRPTLGALPLASVTRGHVKSLLAAKRAAGLAKATVRLIRATMSALYADAIDAEVVAANPATRVGRSRVPDSTSAAERRQQIRAMTPEQLDTFLQAAAGDRQATLWLFLADTGVRPGEAFALRWDNVDLVARQVRVERAAERGGTVKSTKTGSARTVDLTPRLATALDALAKGRDVNALVFPSAAGTLLEDVNVARSFRAILQRAGLPRFNLYSVRHAYASHMLMAGAPLPYVAAQLGHATPATTLQHYAHWIPSGDHGLAERLEAWRYAAARRPQGAPQGNGRVPGGSATSREA